MTEPLRSRDIGPPARSGRETLQEVAWRSDFDATVATDDEEVLVASHNQRCSGGDGCCQHHVVVGVSRHAGIEWRRLDDPNAKTKLLEEREAGLTPATVVKSNTFVVWRGGRPKDFELKLDYRITAAGNSGINYRSEIVPDPVTPENRFAMRGYQFDLDGAKRYPGNNYEEKGRLFLAVRGQMTRVVGGRPPIVLSAIGDPDELAKAVSDDWNAVHVSARGNVLIHQLNGRVMSITIDDDPANRPVDGLIGGQVHVGPPMKVEYRNIRLKLW